MKTRILLLTIIALSLLSIHACKDKDEPVTITSDDAADLVINSTENATFGLAAQLRTSSELFVPYIDSSFCDILQDSTLLKYYGGMSIQYNYTFQWSWKILCCCGAPLSADVDYTSTGNNESSLLSSTFNGSGDLLATGMESFVTEFTFNGTYARSGNMSSKVRGKVAFDYNLAMTLVNVKVSKSSYLIQSGTVDFSLSCTTSEGTTFTFDGKVLMSAGQNCTLTIGEESWSFQL